MDFATPRRSVALRVVSGRAHYDEVVAAAIQAHTSVWIATANLKELMIEDHRAKPGVRRRLGRATYRSVLAAFAELAARGVEIRFLHAERPSRPFRAELAKHPELAEIQMRVCPRVHLKTVVVDGGLLYLGSANWTGAGLGVRGSGRRNFELGIVTDDAQLLDEVQAMYERIWSGGECASCKLRPLCPAPLDGQPSRGRTGQGRGPKDRAERSEDPGPPGPEGIANPKKLAKVKRKRKTT
ncbi:MAG TPA: phospholipase D family protein [Kofleriaceae bacterium]|nr:phospholipase D family protein [Kofleriaceae bacterium]